MKYITFASLVFVVLAIWLTISGFTLSTSEGEHTGYITSVQHTGMIWQTYDAYIKTNTQSSQEDKYCVASPELAAQLQAKQESKENITIVFGHGHWVPLWQCDLEYVDVITSIK